MKTTERNITGLKTKNTRILVNFKSKKIIHSNHSLISDEHKHLLSKGYIPVGLIKADNPKIYWDKEFFEPQDKYITKCER